MHKAKAGQSVNEIATLDRYIFKLENIFPNLGISSNIDGNSFETFGSQAGGPLLKSS